MPDDMTRKRLSGRLRSPLATLAALLLLSSCTVGPDYVRPPAPVPVAYKEIAGWKRAEPALAASGAPWWSVYKDPVLDRLVRQVDVNNQNLKSAEAAFRQARALVAEARAGYFPTVTLDASGQRSKLGSTSSTFGSGSSRIRNSFDASAGATWEVDVWGRIRRTVESDVATAQASAADLASARLSAQAQLAVAYFQLRVDDEIKRLLDATVVAFQRSLAITQNRYAVGVATRADIAQAQAQVETTRSQAVGIGVQRAQLEHAIAVLMGQPPATFSIPPVEYSADVPVVPPGLPSELLERRPDIAAAERLMAAANAEIGIAEAAYFPAITLSASYGFAGTAIDTLLRAASSVWSLGAQASAPVFDGGLRGAAVEAARAAYDQRVAAYRETVLTGFQQVEDNLSTLRILEEQSTVQQGAVLAAQEAEQLTLNQYQAGIIAYTSVVTAQATALNARQNALAILQTRLATSVTLIESLGGGWTAAQLPGDDLTAVAPTQAAGP
jgi:NodT family efflux transporter outer membrane factor (OMF) lipoprotein